jgi:tetratricopeptide (TPR) repeat protein
MDAGVVAIAEEGQPPQPEGTPLAEDTPDGTASHGTLGPCTGGGGGGLVSSTEPAMGCAHGTAVARDEARESTSRTHGTAVARDEPPSNSGSVTLVPAAQSEPPAAAALAAEAARLTRAAGQHGVGTGITWAGVQHAIDRVLNNAGEITRATTTSDVIKAHIQPVTVPPGWTCVPEVTHAENSWYTHHYIDQTTGEKFTQRPPPGTFSLCAKLAVDPETAHFVGAPTHFLSHAHTMNFLETLGSLEAYVSKLPLEEVATMFWWIDGFAIDQHECQYSPPSVDDNSAVWAQTFQEAIGSMGNTVMVLNPWNDPLVLSRLWCLWELQCTVATGSTLGICLSPEQEAAFEAALSSDSSSVISVLSKVDVNLAEGNKKDKQMIMGPIRASPGGAEGLNKTAVEQLRERFVGEKARAWVERLRSADGSLRTDEALVVGGKVAGLLGRDLGHWAESKALWLEVNVGFERLGGADGKGTLAARGQLAAAMTHTGEVPEARAVYEAVLPREIELFGAASEEVLTTMQNLANLLSYSMGDFAAALPLQEAAVKGGTALYGAEAETTLTCRNGLAVTYEYLKRFDEARAEYQAVLDAQRKLLGRRHPSCMFTQLNLADLLHNELGEQGEAITMLREVVEVRATVLGVAHELTQLSAQVLAGWEERKAQMEGMSDAERRSHEDKTCLQRKKLDHDGCGCDGCGKPMAVGVMRLTCELCDYDLCESCAAAAR